MTNEEKIRIERSLSEWNWRQFYYGDTEPAGDRGLTADQIFENITIAAKTTDMAIPMIKPKMQQTATHITIPVQITTGISEIRKKMKEEAMSKAAEAWT